MVVNIKVSWILQHIDETKQGYTPVVIGSSQLKARKFSTISVIPQTSTTMIDPMNKGPMRRVCLGSIVMLISILPTRVTFSCRLWITLFPSPRSPLSIRKRTIVSKPRSRLAEIPCPP